MFVGKVRSLSLSLAPERYSTRVGSNLTLKHQTQLEGFTRNKHSSLLQKLVNYCRKSFKTLSPGMSFQLQKWLHVCQSLTVHFSKTAQLIVEKLAQTTSTLSPINLCHTQLNTFVHSYHNYNCFNAYCQHHSYIFRKVSFLYQTFSSQSNIFGVDWGVYTSQQSTLLTPDSD